MFLPVPVVAASCASSDGFRTASAAAALERHRSGATHREPGHAVHDDHHAPFHTSRLDHRRRYRIRAAARRDNHRSTQRILHRHRPQSASDLNSSPMRASHTSASGAEPADRALRSRTIPIAHSCADPHAPSFNPASMRSRDKRLPRPRVSATSQNPPDSQGFRQVIHRRST